MARTLNIVPWLCFFVACALGPRSLFAQPNPISAQLPQLETLAGTMLDTPVPSDQATVLQQLNRLDDLVGQLARVQTALEPSARRVAQYDEEATKVRSALAAVTPDNCRERSSPELAAFVEAVSDLEGQTPGDTSVLGRLVPESATCATILRDKNAIENALATIRTRLVAEQAARARDAERATDLMKRLSARKAEFMKAMAATSSRQSVAQNLWKIILLVGLLSLAAMFGIRLLNDNIQLEWVRSGQVIQFVTVMLLLSVIMALGLTETLRKNTLGTLLGGIAGYVLSQGVGKAAAQEVARQSVERAHKQAESLGATH